MSFILLSLSLSCGISGQRICLTKPCGVLNLSKIVKDAVGKIEGKLQFEGEGNLGIDRNGL
jgi:hypothetical protein